MKAQLLQITLRILEKIVFNLLADGKLNDSVGKHPPENGNRNPEKQTIYKIGFLRINSEQIPFVRFKEKYTTANSLLT